MLEVYQRDPYLKSLHARVLEVTAMKKRPAVAFAENLLYPGGGGQPCDTGTVTLPGGRRVGVTRVVKFSGKAYAVLAEDADAAPGAEVEVEVDWPRRYRNMRYHTASHVLMGSLAKALVRYAAKGIEIAEDGSSSTIKFEGEWSGDRATAAEHIAAANRVIAEGRAVSVLEFATLEEAVARHGPLFRGRLEIKGPVSIVVIDGWDANPCGGTHVRNISEIGPITLCESSAAHMTFAIVP